MDGIGAMQLQNNYTYALMKMSMRDMETQAKELVEMLSDVPAPAQYNFDVWA